MPDKTFCPFCGNTIELIATNWVFVRSLLVVHLLRCPFAPADIEERMEAATKFADRISRPPSSD